MIHRKDKHIQTDTPKEDCKRLNWEICKLDRINSETEFNNNIPEFWYYYDESNSKVIVNPFN